MVNQDILIRGLFNGDSAKLLSKTVYIENATFYNAGRINVYFLRQWSVDVNQLNNDAECDLLIEYSLDNGNLTIFNNVRIHTASNVLSVHSEQAIYEASHSLLYNIDYETRKGRQILLNTLLYKYRNIHEIPDFLKEKTKVANYLFKRRVDENNTMCVPVSKIVGTTHPDYKGLSWYEVFFRLKRSRTILNTLILSNSRGTLSRNEYKGESVTFEQIDDVFYTRSGSHRTTMLKIIGVESIQANVQIYKTDHNFKKRFDLLRNMGFKVKITTRHEYLKLYRNKVSEHWEILQITLSTGDFLILQGINEIDQFIDYLSRLNKFYLLKLRFKKRLGIGFKSNLLDYFDFNILDIENIEEIIIHNKTKSS